MGDKLTHRQHKWILIFTVLLATIAGMVFSTVWLSKHQGYDVLFMLIFGILLAIVVLLVITVGILVKMEEEFYWHHKKL